MKTFTNVYFSLKAKFPKRRHSLGALAIRHLEDKSSSVRRYAIRVLIKLIKTHPYAMYGGLLDLDEWKERYDDLSAQLAVSLNPDMSLLLTRADVQVYRQ